MTHRSAGPPASKQERLLSLVSLLLKSRRPVTWQHIRESLVGYNNPKDSDNAVARRFERDKAALREMGIPIRYHAGDSLGGEGYFLPLGEVFLPQIELSGEEVAVLAVAGRFARADAASPVAAALESALQKLQFDSPIPGDVRATVEERYLFHQPFGTGESRERARLSFLADAVANNRAVRFVYYAIGADRTSRRLVDPYGLGFSDGHWYLVGRSHERRAVRCFRIDRIRGDVSLSRPDGVGPDFDVPENFRLEEHLGKRPWAFGKVEPFCARVRFDSTVAWMVKQSRTAGDRWADLPDGDGQLERSVTDTEAMCKWVLRFGPHAEVLAPPALRERVVETLRAVRALYAPPQTNAAGNSS